MEAFLKIYLLIFIILFIVLVFVVPSIRVYNQTGINPFRLTTKQNQVHDFLGASMKLFIVLLLLVVIIYALFNAIYRFLAPLEYLEKTTLKIIGLVLGHLAFIGIIIAQWNMRQSWRIGIDYVNKTQLVTVGLFKISRNPIYLFLIIALIGLFLIIPNAVTFAVLFSAYLILQVTIRLEEDFLEKQHGEVYRNYKQKVSRLI